MRKLLILFIVLFLSSCSRGEVDMIDVYFTQGDGIAELSYTNKFSNYNDFSSALENGLRFYNFANLFDTEFFKEHDLIVVYFTSRPYKTCDNFRLNGVQIKDEKLTVSITSLVNLDSSDPQITISGRYFYLIVIDKIDITEVELIWTE